jgi:hypothetical protein
MFKSIKLGVFTEPGYYIMKVRGGALIGYISQACVVRLV